MSRTSVVGVFSFFMVLSAFSTRAFAGGGPAPPGCAGASRQLSNIQYGRIEIGGWYLWGDRSTSPGVVAPYDGGGGGLTINCALALGRWFALDTNYRIAVSGYGQPEPSVDFGLEVGIGFAGAQWRGRLPGSLVLGVGGGAGLGRPIWLGLGASVYPYGYAHFMLKPSRNSRIQLGYRMSPISTQYKYYSAWVRAHDIVVGAGANGWQIGVRARVEDVALLSNPDQDLRSFWMGPFVAFIVL